MAFTASDVKNLRERTGCGMMDCKKALTETNGDFDKAMLLTVWYMQQLTKKRKSA